MQRPIDTGNLRPDIPNEGGHNVTRVLDPVFDDDAANKEYVDAAIAGSGVASIQANAAPALIGVVRLVNGTGISLNQVGQDIIVNGSSVPVITGVGDPEGVAVAAPGTIYLNTAPGAAPGAANETIFVKSVGVGNVGWNRAVLIDRTTGFVLIGQDVQDHGSNAGVQYTSAVTNRAQTRVNQYGANTGVPGQTGFKSRGPVGGPDVGVIDTDVIWRATGVGVCPDGVSIPLSSLLSEQVPAPLVGTVRVAARVGGAVIPNNWLGTEIELQTNSVGGPINGHRRVAAAGSEGDFQTLRGVRAGGPATGATAQGMAEGSLWSSGNGDPNGAVDGSRGDLWTRYDGGAGTTLYVKEVGDLTNNGWVGK